MKITRKLFLVNALVLIVLLSIIELASVLVLDKVYPRAFETALIEPHKYGGTDGLKPNTRGMVWGESFATDENGFRKQTKKTAAKKRVLYIGDSVTEGVGIADSATFCSIINEQNDSIQTLNCSMIGWSIADYRNAIDVLVADSGLQISGITICWCLNDIYAHKPVNKLPGLERFGMFSSISKWLQNHYATYRLVKLFATRNSDNYFRYDSAFYRDNYAIEGALSEISHIKEKCDSTGIELNFVLFPYKSALAGHKNNTEYSAISNMLATALKLHGITRFTDISKAQLTDDCYLFSDEIHLSEKGHRAVADFISSK